jgi:hypothetical protein
MSANDINLSALDRDLQKLKKPERGWFGRNWKWFLPVLILLIMVVGGGGWYYYHLQMSFGGEAYQKAMSKIAENTEIKSSLGEPIQAVYLNPLPSYSKDNANFDVRWSIIGSKNKQAKAHLKTRLMNGKWETVLVEVVLPDGKKVIPDSDEGGNVAKPFDPGPVPAPDANANPESKPKEENLPEELTPNIPSADESK